MVIFFAVLKRFSEFLKIIEQLLPLLEGKIISTEKMKTPTKLIYYVTLFAAETWPWRQEPCRCRQITCFSTVYRLCLANDKTGNFSVYDIHSYIFLKAILSELGFWSLII